MSSSALAPAKLWWLDERQAAATAACGEEAEALTPD
jgi:hypothetical protein